MSKDIFDNTPFTSLNCTISHPASEFYFLEMSTIFSQRASLHISLYMHTMKSFMQLISIKAISFKYVHQKGNFYPYVIHRLEALESDQYFQKSTVRSSTNLSSFNE